MVQVERTMQLEIQDLNTEIRRCNKCRLADTRIHALCGEGNLDARLMLIAQAPGESEDREGTMFIGPSGKILDELLKISDIDRGELYMTNLVKCMLPKYRKPKQEEIDMCSNYLDREIKVIDPEILVPLGHYATTYFFKKHSFPLPSKQEFYTVYGRLFLSGNRKILPLQHPAAVLYNPSIKEVLVKNYHKLKVLSKDCKWYQACPMKRFYEAGILNREWVELYCKGDWECCTRYEMEESGKPHSDWLLPDGTIDERLHENYGRR